MDVKVEARPDVRPEAAGPPAAVACAAGFEALYERWFHPVCAWLRAHGIREGDREDLAQEVFLVADRRLAGFDGRNPAAWLFEITRRAAAGHRRRAWYRTWIGSGSDVDPDELGGAAQPADEALDRVRQRRIVDRLLEKMSEKRRVVFVLFEIEGWTGEDVAAALDVPPKTVWTRLHHARKDFLALVARLAGERDPLVREQAERIGSGSWRDVVDGSEERRR